MVRIGFIKKIRGYRNVGMISMEFMEKKCGDIIGTFA